MSVNIKYLEPVFLAGQEKNAAHLTVIAFYFVEKYGFEKLRMLSECVAQVKVRLCPSDLIICTSPYLRNCKLIQLQAHIVASLRMYIKEL